LLAIAYKAARHLGSLHLQLQIRVPILRLQSLPLQLVDNMQILLVQVVLHQQSLGQLFVFLLDHVDIFVKLAQIFEHAVGLYVLAKELATNGYECSSLFIFEL